MFEAFPTCRAELNERFRTQESCLDFLFKLRWPEGFVCPKCGHTKAWSANRERYICSKCRYHASVTAGTIFHRTRKPLPLWFLAISYVTTHKHGGNALGLQRELGLGSYHTAWEWLHKLRKAMVAPDRTPLSGLVEVDEAYYGGTKSGKSGRGAPGKSLVVVAVEDLEEGGIGRIRLQRVKDASGKSLAGFCQNHIALGSRVRTDGWSGYNKLGEQGYNHLVVGGKKQEQDLGDDPLPLCHRVISLFKRQFLSTFQGAIDHEQLDRYLEEFTFRFNRRKAKFRSLLFLRVLQHAVILPPFPARQIELGLRDYLRGRKKIKDQSEKMLPESFDAFTLDGLADLPF